MVRLILGLWAVAALLAACPLLGWNRYLAEVSPRPPPPSKAYMFGCSFDTWSKDLTSRSFVLLLCTIGYLIPLCIISYSSFSIVMFFKKNNKDVVTICMRVSSCFLCKSLYDITPNTCLNSRVR